MVILAGSYFEDLLYQNNPKVNVIKDSWEGADIQIFEIII